MCTKKEVLPQELEFSIYILLVPRAVVFNFATVAMESDIFHTVKTHHMCVFEQMHM